MLNQFIDIIEGNHCDWLVQERRNYIANALEFRLSCTNPSIWNILIASRLHIPAMDGMKNIPFSVSRINGTLTCMCLNILVWCVYVLHWNGNIVVLMLIFDAGCPESCHFDTSHDNFIKTATFPFQCSWLYISVRIVLSWTWLTFLTMCYLRGFYVRCRVWTYYKCPNMRIYHTRFSSIFKPLPCLFCNLI